MVVYRHIRLDTNQPFYIGIGKSSVRAYRKDGRNKLWSNIAAKTDYKVQILFEDLSKEEACEKEKELILLYGRLQNKTGQLANITSGGETFIGPDNPAFDKGRPILIDGVRFSSISTASRFLNLHVKTIQYRLKSKYMINYNYANSKFAIEKHTPSTLADAKKLANPMFGKKHSAESKQKMSQKLSGRQNNSYQKLIAKVVKPNRKEVIIGNYRFMSIAHASYFLKVSQNVLSKALIKGYKCKGMSVSYASDTLYSKKLIDAIYKHHFDKVDIYPHPKMVEMLKSLS